MNKRVMQLTGERFLLMRRLDACFEVKDYATLKIKLTSVEEELAIAEGSIETYTLIMGLKARIDELQTKRALAIVEKQKCKDLARYRKLVDSVALFEEMISVNEKLIKGARK
jgi:hypothetical protein